MTTPLILLAHGSPDVRAIDATNALAARVAERLSVTVVAAFIDHAEPDVTGAAGQLRDAGFDTAVVVPLFLSRAFHVRVDVPAAVATAREATGMDLAIAPPLGLVTQWREYLDTRLPAGPVILATAGTSSASAQQDIADFATEWAALRGAEVVPAYASQAQPDVATAIAETEARLGQSVSVAALVLFDGLLPDRITQAAGERACSAPLDRSEQLVDVVVSRYKRCGLIEKTEDGPRCHECSAQCNRREIQQD